MRNRRTNRVALAALGLTAISLVLFYLSPGRCVGRPTSGWQVTLSKNGTPVRADRCEQLPRDFASLYPEVHAGSGYSLTVEAAETATPIQVGGLHFASADRASVEFLLLLPPATLLVCLFRNIVGLNSFGTFAPALMGLAFRDVNSLLGVFVVLTIISAGWWLRRGLDELHLLQAPRTAVMLSCIVILLLGLMFMLRGPGPRAITLFPLVILTGMIERFWSMEEEDGTVSSLGVLLSTLFMAICVWVMATMPVIPAWMFHHPETLGLVIAAQLLLGRYTGFRFLELYRFRSLIAGSTPVAAALSEPLDPGAAVRFKQRRKRRLAWEP